MSRYILALDEGTTSARAVIYDEKARVVGQSQREFTQIYPEPGWVEHNPDEIWAAQLTSIKDAIRTAEITPDQIAAIGITNQRETTVIWDKAGTPIYNAIVWQCRRTSRYIEEVKLKHESLIKEKTGLIPDSYFSAPKVRWILDNVPEVRTKAQRDGLYFGTMDSYLIYKLTAGKVHSTDPSNASRTLLYNIRNGDWDQELLELFNIPESMLPEVKPSSELIGYTDLFGSEIPITGCAGDQQASLFGHQATAPGDSKCTYGTGNFLLMNTGDNPVFSERLLTTVAWEINGVTTYALEGSVFTSGAAVQWLRDGLGIIESAEETEALAESLEGNDGVYMVPAFSGLGAPHWDQFARGSISGLTRGTGRAHIIRATLESIAYQTHDLVEEMQRESGYRIACLRVDGGASVNGFLMQHQSDILGVPVVRPVNVETTALGVAYLAGLAIGFWKSSEVSSLHSCGITYEPKMSRIEADENLSGWRDALRKTLNC